MHGFFLYFSFFETMSTVEKAAAVGGALIISWFFEAFNPLVRFDYKKWRHAGINFTFLIFTFAINFFFPVLQWVSSVG